jgi:hypothetical protein
MWFEGCDDTIRDAFHHHDLQTNGEGGVLWAKEFHDAVPQRKKILSCDSKVRRPSVTAITAQRTMRTCTRRRHGANQTNLTSLYLRIPPVIWTLSMSTMHTTCRSTFSLMPKSHVTAALPR